MNKCICVLGVLFIPFLSWGQFEPMQNEEGYQVYMDLTASKDYHLPVEVVVPILNEEEVVYQFPAMIPGTYEVYNFGQYVEGLYAINGFDDTLEVTRLNTNQWKIKGGQGLYKIGYKVKGTFHQKTDVFLPAGTVVGQDVFLLNNFGFVGFIEGKEDYTFELQVRKDTSLFGSTALPVMELGDTLDVYQAEDYFQMHDCPIMYAQPDTASVVVEGTRISLGVYSPYGNMSAAKLIDAIKPVFTSAATYLGGSLPVEHYAILVYGVDLASAMEGVGALEHHTSTVVIVPDFSEKQVDMLFQENTNEMLRDIVSHEFFHIVTPLNIHSEYVHDYDFMNPKMSKHLWFYEGVTEYNSLLSLVRSGVMTEEHFLSLIQEKLFYAEDYNPNIPFTVSSQFALSYFKEEYNNVYEKGALIGMCLDLTLRKETEGSYGLRDLLSDLEESYGRDTFFVDEEFFDIITNTSGVAGVREYFARYVEGAEPLPIKELLAEAGYEYLERKTILRPAWGNWRFYSANGETKITGVSNERFKSSFNVEPGDVLYKWAGQPVDPNQFYEQTIPQFVRTAQEGDQLELEVKRIVKGKEKVVKLKSKVFLEELEMEHVLAIDEAASEQQSQFKAQWLGL